MKQYKTWICFLCSFLLYASIHSQSVIPVSRILSSVRDDDKISLQQQHIDYINRTNRNIPFADQVSLRTETDRFLVYRQEYLARLSVNGFGEMNKQRKLNQATLVTEQQVIRQYEHESLLNRYDAVSTYKYLLRRLALQADLNLVLADKVSVLNKLAALNTGVEVDELIKEEYDRDALVLDMDESQSQFEIIKNRIKAWLETSDDTWALDTSGFISTAQMQLVIHDQSQSASMNPWITEKQLSLDETRAAYNLEKASASQMLDFFQIRYANRPNETLISEFSAGFGINLPFKGSSRVKLAELKIEQDNIQQEMQQDLLELNESIVDAKQQMDALIKRKKIAEDQWLDSQHKFSFENPIPLQADGPMTLLKAHELQIKRKLYILDLDQEIINQYVKILDLTGAISAAPLVNYLSAGLENY